MPLMITAGPSMGGPMPGMGMPQQVALPPQLQGMGYQPAPNGFMPTF
jgi:hypothetical protein